MGLNAKLRLAEALNCLLEEKQLKEITVVMLTQKSGLARRTFYDNFLDIYDLQLWFHEYLVRDVTENFWKGESIERVFLRHLERMQCYHNYYRQLLTVEGPNAFSNTFVRINVERSSKYLGVSKKSDLYFVIEAYTAGAANQIYQWIERDMPVPPKELCRLLMMSMPEMLRQAYAKGTF